MTQLVEPEVHVTLEDYAAVASLASAVAELWAEAARLVPRLRGRTIWMINSTATGGGVAELLPAQVALLGQLGVQARWVAMQSAHPEFFALTKRIHNLIHGEPEHDLDTSDRFLYETVSRENADDLRARLAPNDILVVHDPQPLAVGALLKQAVGVRTVWRCHIGLDEHLPATRTAWEFLRPYATTYDRAIFSAPEYIPDYLAGCASVIHPALDPLSHKNRDLSLHKLVGILCDSTLAVAHWPLIAPQFPEGARRLQPDGSYAPATVPDDIGLLSSPIIAQVSRWDRLKGFGPLLEAFRLLTLDRGRRTMRDDRHRQRMENVRLVLAGPDPAGIQDDPGALAVLGALGARYVALEPAVQRNVALLTLPMASRKHNALMVNALQRCADLAVQNSLREGFGLTVAEAMWKRTPILASSRATGVRRQVRDGLDGRLVPDPEDSNALAEAMHEMLRDSDELEVWGRSAQRRVHDEFLIFTELRRWMQLLVETVERKG